MAENTKKFLSYEGLSTFWTLIKDKFADKNAAAKYDSLAVNVNTSGAVISISNLGTTGEGGTLQTKTATIPYASTTKAGIISATDYTKLNNLDATLQDKIKFNGLQIATADGNTDVTIDSNKKSAIKLEYSLNSTNNTAKIKLVDANDADVYSEIDVSALLKTGLLNDVELVVNPTGQTAGTYLKMTFMLANGSTTVEYVNVSDLIDIYTVEQNGGLEITAAGVDPSDGTQSTRIIKLKAATSSTLGGIKTGYTTAGTNYAVKLDASSNAYVTVPETKIAKGSNTDEFVSVDVTKSTDTYVISVTSKGIDTIKATANSAVQTATGDSLVSASKTGTTITVGATEDLTDAVAKANASLQDAAGDSYINVNVDSNKKATVSLKSGTIASLGKADTAVQSIAFGDKTLSKSDAGVVVIDTDTVKSKLGLKGAAYKDVYDGDFTTVDTSLPTSEAVKTYVSGEVNKITGGTGSISTQITAALDKLDATVGVNSSTDENGASKPTFVRGFTQVNGLIKSPTLAMVSISDIANFSEITNAEITALCV